MTETTIRAKFRFRQPLIQPGPAGPRTRRISARKLSVFASRSLQQLQNMHKVFVYGTLMANEVVTALLERPHARFEASLSGFKRFSIQQQVFPAIMAASSKDTVQGWVGGLSALCKLCHSNCDCSFRGKARHLCRPWCAVALVAGELDCRPAVDSSF